MKITKDYPGLTQIYMGDYVLAGDLISEEGIEVDLDNNLIVVGDIIAKLEIESKHSIKAAYNIKAERGIKSGGDIFAGWSIETSGKIYARWNIISGHEIIAKRGIEAGFGIISWRDIVTRGEIKTTFGGIIAGWDIKAGTYIDCGNRIFAGTSTYHDRGYINVRCTELRKGKIAYGRLITKHKK